MDEIVKLQKEKDMEDIDNIIIPVGGGGLASGVAAYLKESGTSMKPIVLD